MPANRVNNVSEFIGVIAYHHRDRDEIPLPHQHLNRGPSLEDN